METNKPGFFVTPETECKRLLEIANLSLYRNNSFRVLNVPVDATERALARHIQTLKFTNPDTSDSDLLQEAYQRIRNLEYRAVDEFFALWNPEAGGESSAVQWPDNPSAVNELQLYKACRTLETAAADRYDLLHDYAVRVHSLALDLEAEDLRHSRAAGMNPIVDFLWRESLDAWRKCIRQEQTWDYFKDRVRSMNDPRLTTGFVRRFRGTLPLSLCLINIHLALNYLEKNAREKAVAHLNSIKQCGMDPEVVEAAWKLGCGPVIESLRIQCREIKRGAKQDPHHANDFLRRMYGEMEKTVSVVVDVLPEGHSSREPICDEIATAIYECQIAATANGGSLSESLEWLRKADALPVSPLLRHRLRENIRVLRLNLDNETCWFCKEFLSTESSSLVYDREARRCRSIPPSRAAIASAPSLVMVPRCPRCESYHATAVSLVLWGIGLGLLAGGLLTFAFHLLSPLPYIEMILPVSAAWGAGLGFISARLMTRTLVPSHVLPESAGPEYPKVKDLTETVCPAKPCCAEPSH